MAKSAPAADAPRKGFISIFYHHPVAANLLMVMLLLAGVWGVKQLNTQFFPTFSIDFVSVVTTWSGASANDVEELITTPLEQELRDIDFVKEMTSTSSEGVSSVILEFEEGTDMGAATDQVKERVALVSGLPDGADTPEVSKIVNYEDITRLLVTGSGNLDELRNLVHEFENELLARGIARVEINGLPEERIAIEIPTQELRRIGMSLDDIGRRVAAWSKDVPVGIAGRAETSQQLRFRERRTDELSFESIPVVAGREGKLLTLGDIARIQREPRPEQVSNYYQGRPAVEMTLRRTENSDSLQSAQIFNAWLKDVRPRLPEGVSITPFNADWQLLSQRINLLLENGIGGLILVILILFLFMSGRVAWWTAVGIPVSFMAALAMLYLIGGSINMISVFGLIMALGIIVDDAIVVGEEAMSGYERGLPPQRAVENAAHQMLGPVFSSSLTTISAFMPLLLVGGIIGTIMQAIPTVVVCVILASLVECFLILPGHLHHSLRKMGAYRPGRIRKRLDNGFTAFRDGFFRPIARAAVNYRWFTLACTIAAMIVSVGWLASGRLGFHFFPTAEADRVYANISFVSGTPADTVKSYLAEAETALYEVQEEIGEQFIQLVIRRHGALERDGEPGGSRGDHLGAVRAELVDPDQRRTRNREIIAAWRAKLPRIPGIENLAIAEPRVGPPGEDIDVRLSGADIAQVKLAAQDLQNVLRDISGVSAIRDDSPYGREQLVLQLTPTAEALGLSVENVSRQLRAAYNGFEVQELSDGYDDVSVRIMLPADERDSLAGLDALNIVLPNGRSAPVGNLITLNAERGFEIIRHSNGKLAITVTANVDPAVNNANRINAELRATILPQLSQNYGVQFSFEGRQADQAETLGDMRLGAGLAFVLIYLVLAWVFGSYGWPLIVMFIIPFGMVGAIWGHVIMEKSFTILSLFGFFALSGIVVNDSIILVVRYKQLRAKGMAIFEAVVEAACQRLRAVLLTSLTTIAGLSPLLFETSLQAQFLIPMATTLAFGLGFATLLVLLAIPALLMIYESARHRPNQQRKTAPRSAPKSRRTKKRAADAVATPSL